MPARSDGAVTAIPASVATDRLRSLPSPVLLPVLVLEELDGAPSWDREAVATVERSLAAYQEERAGVDARIEQRCGSLRSMRAPVTGGTRTTLAKDQYYPGVVAVDATSVYWENSYGPQISPDHEAHSEGLS